MAATSPPAGAAGAVPELSFEITGAHPVEHTAAPTIGFGLRIDAGHADRVRSVLLDTQIQIAARRRSYDAAEQERLYEVFGAPEGWGSTLRTVLWSRTTTVVPPFDATTEVELQVACSYDVEVAGAEYLAGLRDGEVPLEFLFSGTVFYAGPGGGLQAARISWEEDAEFRLPVAIWRQVMDRHFRGRTWLRLTQEHVDALHAYRARNALASWDDTVEALLSVAEGR